MNRDRLRTSVNVLGDSYGAAVVGHLSRLELAEIDKLNEFEIELGETDVEKKNGPTGGDAGDDLYPDLKS